MAFMEYLHTNSYHIEDGRARARAGVGGGVKIVVMHFNIITWTDIEGFPQSFT